MVPAFLKEVPEDHPDSQGAGMLNGDSQLRNWDGSLQPRRGWAWPSGDFALGLRALTSIDAQQRVDQILGGAVGAVGGQCGQQAVLGPTGLKILLWFGLCGVRRNQPVRVLVTERRHLNRSSRAGQRSLRQDVEPPGCVTKTPGHPHPAHRLQTCPKAPHHGGRASS